MNDRALDALLTLTLTPGLGPTLIRRCTESMGTGTAVLEATVNELASIRGIGARRAATVRRAMDATLADTAAVSREKALIQQQGVRLLAFDDPDYPRLLRHIPDPPPLLYARGRLQDDDAVALAVVGTRRCSAYGREQADRLSVLCSQAGLCITSGGARGIDAVAHRAALRAGGRTIAVLGSGLAQPYPPEHRDLFDQIATGNGDQQGSGAVISEMPMMTPPLPENFPRRNRIVSGLSLGVLVIEAPIGSGALITARLAVEEQGREVMAIPGRVDSRLSAGCHRMIRENWATLVTNVADVLDVLGETGQLLKAPRQPDQPHGDADHATTETVARLTDTQSRLLAALNQPRSIDQLSAQTGLAVSAVQANVTMLELHGLITRKQGLCQRRRGQSHVSTSI